MHEANQQGLSTLGQMVEGLQGPLHMPPQAGANSHCSQTGYLLQRTPWSSSRTNPTSPTWSSVHSPPQAVGPPAACRGEARWLGRQRTLPGTPGSRRVGAFEGPISLIGAMGSFLLCVLWHPQYWAYSEHPQNILLNLFVFGRIREKVEAREEYWAAQRWLPL